MIAPLVTKLTDTVEISPTVELNEVPVIIPLKLNFLEPDVSKKRLNEASPASSVVNTSEIINDVLTSEDAGDAAFNLFLDTSGSKKLSFNGIITGTSFSSRVGDISTVSVSFVTNGAITSAI